VITYVVEKIVVTYYNHDLERLVDNRLVCSKQSQSLDGDPKIDWSNSDRGCSLK
jgi:hypothetical protein